MQSVYVPCDLGFDGVKYQHRDIWKRPCPSTPWMWSPGRRAKKAPIVRKRLRGSRLKHVGGLVDIIRSPPVRKLFARKPKRQRHDNHTDCQANIKGTRHDIIVLLPPAEVASADEPVERQAKQDVIHQVPSRRGRHHTRRAEYGGREQIPEPGAWVAAREEVMDHWADGADKPKPVDPGEKCTSTKHALRTLYVSRAGLVIGRIPP